MIQYSNIFNTWNFNNDFEEIAEEIIFSFNAMDDILTFWKSDLSFLSSSLNNFIDIASFWAYWCKISLKINENKWSLAQLHIKWFNIDLDTDESRIT